MKLYQEKKRFSKQLQEVISKRIRAGETINRETIIYASSAEFAISDKMMNFLINMMIKVEGFKEDADGDINRG